MLPFAYNNEFFRIDRFSYYPDVTRDSYSTNFPWSFEPTGVGAGLYNSGNTCFIASVLQCFTHTVPLLESLRSYKSQNPCNCGSETFCILQALQEHIKVALMSSGSYITTDRFRDNLNHFSSDFQINNQEDAHEFLQSFLDKLERCLNPRNRPGSVSSQDGNIVDHVFGGRLMSRLHCCSCNSFSDTLETSLGWSLEIEDVDNLLKALESFTRVEELEDQLTCDNCKEKVSKKKQFKLDKLPLVATFHLKRFKNDGHTMKKISKHVEFPLELDLLSYMNSNQNSQVSTKYHLYAIVEHLGNRASFGHYSSYVRSAPKTWHKFDDAKVTRISEDYVLSKDVYMLFYAREGTPWFSSAFEVPKPWYLASPLYSSPKPVLEASWRGQCVSDHDYENTDNFKFSTNPVLETSWRDECVSDYSNENVGTSNKACNDSVELSIPDVNYSDLRCHESHEQVFHSTDRDGDSYMSDDFESRKADNSFAETSHQDKPNLLPAGNKASIDAAYVPVQNQDMSPKCKDPKAKEIALSYRKKIPTSCSSAVGQPYTIKKRKISKNRRSTMGQIYTYISDYFGVLRVIALESALKHIEHISRRKSNTYISFYMKHILPH